MYKLCKTEQSAERQRQLEQGLQKAMLTQQYELISVSDLCDRLEVPRKSFYRYFSSKEGALFALIDHTLMEFIQVPPKSRKSRESAAIADLERFFVFWHERKSFLEALKRSRLSGLLVERATSHALNERLMPMFLYDEPEHFQKMAMTFVVCGLLSMVLDWHQGGYQQTPAYMAQMATQMLSHPLIHL